MTSGGAAFSSPKLSFYFSSGVLQGVFRRACWLVGSLPVRGGLGKGQRILFQMSAADSSHLLDSPIANRLGRNRALYDTDELGQPEKSRPYGLPSLAWLEDVKRRCGDSLPPTIVAPIMERQAVQESSAAVP
jgi:hypothetical protein